MANPILTSDLYKDDGALKEAITQLQALSNEYSTFVDNVKNQAVQLETSVKKTNVATVQQREQLKQTAEQVDKIEQEYNKYTSLLSDHAIQIAALKNAQQKLNKVNKLEAKVMQSRKGSLNALNAQLKLNQERLNQLTEAEKTNTREGVKLVNQTERLTLKIKELKDEQRRNIKIRELERKAAKSQSGSYDQLSAQYSILKIKLNAMSDAQRANTAQGQKMEKQSEAIYAEMNRLQKLTGKHVLNVGNYTNSIVEAFNRQTKLTKELKKLKEEFKKLPKSIRNSVVAQKELADATDELTLEIQELEKVTGKSVKQMESLEETNENLLDSIEDLPGALGQVGGSLVSLGRHVKSFLSNPLVLTLALIAGAAITLFKAFTRSEKGVQLMTKATGLINGLWSQAIKIVDTLTTSVVNLVTKPKESFKSFGKLIVDQIVNRFRAVTKFVGLVGQGINQLINRDFKGLKQTAKDATSALIQFTSGLDQEQQVDFAKAIAMTTAEVLIQTDAFIDLEVAKRNTANANRELQKTVENLTTQEELYKSIADDTTKSFKEREEAEEQAREALEQRSRKEIEIAKNNLGLVNTELDLRKANGEAVDALLDQQLAAYQQLAQAERQYTLAVRNNERTRDELKQDRLERDLDILLDGFDNQLKVNEKIIKDDSKTFAERQRLLEETRKLSDDSFRKQIETIQEFTGVQVEANKLIGESDAVVLNQKIRSLGLSEKIEGRLLEIVRDRKDAVQDLADTERELNEAKVKFDQEKLKNDKKAAQEEFNIEQELKKSEFALTESTEKEKNDFRLNAEKDRLKKILELNKRFGGDLTDLQKQIIKNQIQAIDNELAKVTKTSRSIYDLFGLNLNDEQEEALNQSFNFAKDQVFQFAAARTQAANQRVTDSQNAVQAAQQEYDAQVALAAAGYSNQVDTAKRELELAKSQQKQALAERTKAQRAELALQSVEQASNLVTASTTIWKQLGFPFAIPAIALMWGSFLSAKVRAFQLAKSPRSEGGLDIVGGGTHASGNDTYLGYSDSKGAVHAERGEAHMVLTPKQTQRYKNVLPDIYRSLSNGTFHNDWMNRMNYSNDIPIFTNTMTNIDMSGTERRLDDLRAQGVEKYFNDQNGNLVRIYKNLKQTYVS